VKKRRLGRTGHMSSVVIMGTAALWEISQEGANAALDLALAHGVSHIDVAPQYGMAEERVGPWLEHRRHRFFVGCKTQERSRESAWAELHRSLERLRVDALDLYQLHAVGTFEELDKALAPGGAIEALVEAREAGLTRYLGITGHGLQAPAVHAAALERFDFDTVMFPLNPTLYADPSFRRDAERVLRMAAERDVGVMIIKSIAKGLWGEREQAYNTWYEPFDTQEEIERGVRFALSQPVTAIVSAGDVRLLPMVLRAGEEFQSMGADEQAALIEQGAALEPIFGPE
jgi:aryl-alcohol dehydrogenase-like predicted oxidoreductase